MSFGDLARHVYFTETGGPLPRERVPNSPKIGVCRGVAVYLLYNGILGDKSVNGGKTLLACHTVGIALKRYVPANHAVVLWLVPSNTILDQTADALRDARHPYRRALELECAGPVEVLTIEEARSNGRCLFLMPPGPQWALIDKKIRG